MAMIVAPTHSSRSSIIVAALATVAILLVGVLVWRLGASNAVYSTARGGAARLLRLGAQHSSSPSVVPLGGAAVVHTQSSLQYDVGIQERLWEYKPWMSARSLRQGLYSFGEGSRMRRFTHKLLSGEPVSISAVGGSVTAGQGAIYGNPYMHRIWNWIKDVSPHANHTLKHAAFGGSSSGIFAVCVKDMVQADVDLCRPAVVLLQHYSWFQAGGGGDVRADYLITAENDFNVLAHTYYSGHEKSEVEEDLFYYDPVHPQDGTGHRSLMDLVVALVRATAIDLSQRPLGREDEEIAQGALPSPLVPGNLQRRSSTCLLQRDFEKVVVAQQGFTWANERPAADLANEKWGWISEVPDSWAELEVDTTSDLEGDLKPQTNQVIITHLKSYEHMGKAKVQCVSNCKCNETFFNGFWTEKQSLTELHRFQASQHKVCKLRVSVLDESSSPDAGHKVKLVGVMVVEGGFSVDALGIQLDLFAGRKEPSLVMDKKP